MQQNTAESASAREARFSESLVPPVDAVGKVSPTRWQADHTEDVALIDALKRHDSFAESNLVRRFTPSLLHYFVARGVDVDDADDLVQVTFLHALRGLTTFRLDATLSTWLHGIANNVIRAHLRAVGRRERLASRLRASACVSIAFERDVGDPYVRARLRTTLETLRPAERSALLMHVAGFTHREIGILLSVAVGTSKALVHRARKRAQQSLANATDETDNAGRRKAATQNH